MQGTGGEDGEQHRHQEISGGHSGEGGSGEEGGRLVMLVVWDANVCMSVVTNQFYTLDLHRKNKFSFIKMYCIDSVQALMCCYTSIVNHEWITPDMYRLLIHPSTFIPPSVILFFFVG